MIALDDTLKICYCVKCESRRALLVGFFVSPERASHLPLLIGARGLRFPGILYNPVDKAGKERRCCRMAKKTTKRTGGAKLTPKQARFVEEYLIDLNATQAAIRAGYSPETAQQTGSENLSKPVISSKISKAMAERSKRTGVNQDRIVLELAKIAFVNPGEVVDTETATIREGATSDDTAAIQSVKVKTIPTKDGGEGTEREIRFNDKLKALELLGKHCGMWNDKLNVNVNLPVFISGEDQLEE